MKWARRNPTISYVEKSNLFRVDDSFSYFHYIFGDGEGLIQESVEFGVSGSATHGRVRDY